MESANWTYLYYFITGWGSAFVLPTANLQQIPAYEKSQPEGLCIGGKQLGLGYMKASLVAAGHYDK